MRPGDFKCQQIILCSAITVLAACSGEDPAIVDGPEPAPIVAEYIGGEVCADCHMAQSELWRGSHHDLAMQTASSETVLGDFDDAQFTYNNEVTTFSVRDDEYWVNTPGADGQLQDFRITHTFGVHPLQQYLTELPRGHVQALSIAWDSRSAAEGGQRWFHLYPDDAIDSSDPLHWTGTYQNWNTMCAECHSTNLQKAYDSAADTFTTTFSEINVDCEACHGPGSAHSANPTEYSLAAPRRERAWVFVGESVTAALQAGTASDHEIEICAQCHARRGQLTDDWEPGDAFLDAYRPSLLDRNLYHADGQILDEVYVYGSFLQSRMHSVGVTCSDCHEPHSAEVRTSGNALCSQCHKTEAFDTPEHHHHETGSTGAQCVNCHMPAETYMVVDPRRDHSLRVPRPDLTLELGTPNACADCHAEQSAQWAADQVAAWFPEGRQNEFHYGQALHAGRSWSADRTQLLQRVISDESESEIVRATAVSLLANSGGDAALDAVERGLRGTDELVLLASLEALASMPPAFAVQAGQRFLTHELRALRIAAAVALLPARAGLSERRRADLDAALAEHLSAQDFNSDRGEGLTNQAATLSALGRIAEAEAVYQRAIARESAFTPTYINLSDLYRETGRESEAQALLRDGIEIVPEDPALYLALGLSLVRSGNLDDAIDTLAQTVELGAQDPYYHYVFGVALNSTGESKRAIEVLEAAHARFPAYRDIIFGLATMLRELGETERAIEYARRLQALSPSDASAQALLAELESAR